MHFERLKWLGMLAPVFFIGALEVIHVTLGPAQVSHPGPWWFVTMSILAAVAFYYFLLKQISKTHDDLRRRNRELLALHRAGLGIASELSLDAVLQKIIDQARELLGTRYAALSIYDEDDHMTQFVTSGMDDRQGQLIGPPPAAVGLFSVVLQNGQSLRLDDILEDPRVHGFPPNHPHMQRLLAVPVISRSAFRGNLYLTDPIDDHSFTDEDEEILLRFATQAGVAVDNAHLYARLEGLTLAEERLRLAREMHDGQAQVLAFVSTKAQAVREYLNQGDVDEAKQQLDQLAEASREVYADVREGILGLRAVVDPDHAFHEVMESFIERWQDQSGISAQLQLDELPEMAADVELQLLRIVQEGLANVRKHANASEVHVMLCTVPANNGGPPRFRAVIEDDGRGFDPMSIDRHGVPRFGLATMRERADAIGARLDVISAPGKGTRIELTLELPDGSFVP